MSDETNDVETKIKKDYASGEEASTPANETREESEPTSKPEVGLKGREYVRSLLNKKMMILAKDGRVFIGNFHCTDKQLNIILEACSEYQSVEEMKGGKDKRKKNSRYHNLIIIADKFIASIFVHKD